MLKLLKRKTLNRGAYWISYFRLRSILKDITASSILIDCGANQGDISLLFAKKQAAVFAFEPDPTAYQILIKRCKNFPNIQCFQKGVSIKNGKSKMFLHKERAKNDHHAYTVGSSIVSEKNNVDKEHYIEIELIDLTEYINSFTQQIDVLKMDIEGAEIEILEKFIAEKTYEKINLILVETHENKIPGHLEKINKIKDELNKKNIQNIKLNWI